MNIVSFGGGTNSTAMIIGMYQNNIPIDLILFADIADGAALYLIARDSVPLYPDMQEMSLFVGLVKYILCSKKWEA